MLVVVASLPSFQTLWNIGILLHKQATQTKYFDGQWMLLTKAQSLHDTYKLNLYTGSLFSPLMGTFPNAFFLFLLKTPQP